MQQIRSHLKVGAEDLYLLKSYLGEIFGSVNVCSGFGTHIPNSLPQKKAFTKKQKAPYSFPLAVKEIYMC